MVALVGSAQSAFAEPDLPAASVLEIHLREAGSNHGQGAGGIQALLRNHARYGETGSTRHPICGQRPQRCSHQSKMRLGASAIQAQTTLPWEIPLSHGTHRLSVRELSPIRVSLKSFIRFSFEYLSSFVCDLHGLARSPQLVARSSEALHKILPRQLADLAVQFEFEEGGEDFGGG